MKYILLTLLAINLTATELMTTREHLLLHNYNKKPALKEKQKRTAHKLHKVDEQKAKEIVKKLTGEDTKYIKLFHRGKVLKYFIKTESGKTIILNALSGEVLYQR